MAEGITFASKKEAIDYRDSKHHDGYDAKVQSLPDGRYKVVVGEKLMYSGAGGSGMEELRARERQEKAERDYGFLSETEERVEQGEEEPEVKQKTTRHKTTIEEAQSKQYPKFIWDESGREFTVNNEEQESKVRARIERRNTRYREELKSLSYPKKATDVHGKTYTANNEQEWIETQRLLQNVKAKDESKEIRGKQLHNIVSKYVRPQGAIENMHVGSVKAGMKRSIPTMQGEHPRIGSTPQGMISDVNKPRIASETGMPKIAQAGYLGGEKLKAYPYFKSDNEKKKEEEGVI